MTPPAIKNFRFCPLTKALLGVCFSTATDATVEYPLQSRGQEHRRGTKDQNDAPVQRANRQSHPPPPERELIGPNTARDFQREHPSIYTTRAQRQAVERQYRARGQEHEQRQLGDF